MNYGMCSGYELFRIVKFNTNFGIKLQDIETFDLDSKYVGLPMGFLQDYCRNKNKKVYSSNVRETYKYILYTHSFH